MRYFGWAQRMKLYVWKFSLDVSEGSGIKIQSQFRVMPALQQELITSIFYRLRNFFSVHGHIRDISIGASWYPVKIAKFTIGNTDIRRVHISVYLPGDFSV